MSFNQIREFDLDAAYLLEFVPQIEPKTIPASIIPSLQSDVKMSRAIGTLIGYGLLTKRGGEGIFDMHSLVHLATQIWVHSLGHTVQAAKSTVEHLLAIFPSEDYANRTLWRAYLPHTLQVLQRHADEDYLPKERSWLYRRAGNCLLEDGRVQRAIWCFEEGFKSTKLLPEDHPDRIAMQNGLARAYQYSGRAEKAINLLEHVVYLRKQALAKDHPDLLSSQHTLATAYQRNGQIQKAIDLLEYVVSVRRQTLPEDHSNLLATQHELAVVYQMSGQVQKAINLLEHVVSLRKQTLVEDHPDLLASQHELAVSYRNDGQIQRATDLLEHVVSAWKEPFAKDHPGQLASENWLRYIRSNDLA